MRRIHHHQHHHRSLRFYDLESRSVSPAAAFKSVRAMDLAWLTSKPRTERERSVLLCTALVSAMLLLLLLRFASEKSRPRESK
ncbi:hypothetical protein M0802_006962 [Mischocyttarus mexicanus]|nr:hypothetical protein M0802_006962 [Mischocyttarus mexicanus]